jgi:hypothetical protein
LTKLRKKKEIREKNIINNEIQPHRSDEVLPRSLYPSRLCLHLFLIRFSIFNYCRIDDVRKENKIVYLFSNPLVRKINSETESCSGRLSKMELCVKPSTKDNDFNELRNVFRR